MKTEFKVGDRVAVYGRNHGGELEAKRRVGVVHRSGFNGLREIDIKLPCGRVHSFYEQQCRRLKPRAKLREVWIDKEWVDRGDWSNPDICRPSKPGTFKDGDKPFWAKDREFVRFREVRK